MPDPNGPRVPLTPAQRDELRRHYLMNASRQPDDTWRWRCSCREAGGAEKSAPDCRRVFSRHLEEIKLRTLALTEGPS